MKYLLALVVVGLVVGAGSAAFAQDAFYRYDSNAHNYHNYNYPVDWHGHHHHYWPAYNTSAYAVVHYYPVYRTYYHHDYHYHHHYHGCHCW